ncbi:hypothetical protein [Burkholderia thailandensis]|uniref:hypothetical protein n=1 Tax=Burkholderia thailandensis TaxID=57975 RepID=UPI0012DA87FA|nr:hypothetical protein [Burkholderia thailandensis]
MVDGAGNSKSGAWRVAGASEKEARKALKASTSLAAGCWLLAAGCWPPASNDLDVPAFIAIIAINAEVKR